MAKIRPAQVERAITLEGGLHNVQYSAGHSHGPFKRLRQNGQADAGWRTGADEARDG
jgi:hypothetical protein